MTTKMSDPSQEPERRKAQDKWAGRKKPKWLCPTCRQWVRDAMTGKECRKCKNGTKTEAGTI